MRSSGYGKSRPRRASRRVRFLCTNRRPPTEARGDDPSCCLLEGAPPMKVQSAALAMAIAFGMISGACTVSADNPTGTGGSTSSGTAGVGGTTGSGGTGGGTTCPNVTACGGNVVGTWNVTSSCLALGGKLDISLAGLDPTSCTNVGITGSLNVSGSWTGNADGTYMDGATTMGTARLDLPA